MSKKNAVIGGAITSNVFCLEADIYRYYFIQLSTIVPTAMHLLLKSLQAA